jgi:hypothetical protein
VSKQATKDLPVLLASSGDAHARFVLQDWDAGAKSVSRTNLLHNPLSNLALVDRALT